MRCRRLFVGVLTTSLMLATASCASDDGDGAASSMSPNSADVSSPPTSVASSSSSNAPSPTSPPATLATSTAGSSSALVATDCAPPAATGRTSSIEVWSEAGRAEDFVAEVVDRFNAGQTAVAAHLAFTGTRQEILDRLRTGRRPDVVVQGIDGLINLDDAGVLVPLERCLAIDPSISADDLLPIAMATYQREGRQLAMPVMVSTPVMYFNVNRLRAAGLDPANPPQSLTELRAALEALVADGATGGLVYEDARWFVTEWAAQLGIELFAGSNGRDAPVVYRDVKAAPGLTDPKLLAALDELNAMAVAGLIAEPRPDPSKVADLQALISPTDPAALDIHTSGSASFVYDFVEAKNDPSLEVGIAPIPGPGSGSLVGGVGAMCLARLGGDPWNCWQLISALVSPEEQARNGTVGYAPVRRSALTQADLVEAWTRRPGLRVAYDVLAAVNPTSSALQPVVGPPETLDWRLQWLGEDITGHRRSTTEAINAALDDIVRATTAYADQRRSTSATAQP